MTKVTLSETVKTTASSENLLSRTDARYGGTIG